MKLYNYIKMSFFTTRSHSPYGVEISSFYAFRKVLLALAFIVFCTAQGFAQLDTLHLLPPFGGGVGNNEQPGDMFLYLSTPSTDPVNYTITDASGNNVIQTGTVVNGSPVRYDDYGIASGVAVAHSDLNSVLSSNVGFKVVSDAPIYVNLRLRSIDGSQAGSLTSKGNNALGTVFRLGSIPNKQNDSNKGTTFGVVATENNTTVNIDLTGSGVTLVGPSAPSTNSVITVTLDEGECYVLRCDAEDDPDNLDGMIGGLVTSNKPIVVNTGSWCGEPSTSSGRDYGIDQIVGVEKIGTDYIFVRAQGGNDREKPLIVAHTDNTEIYVNASATPIATINAGEWYDINGSNYVSGVMSVYTSEPTFAYQLLAGNNAGNTAGMNFVPDLSCQVDSVISEIPDISKVGGNTFSGGVTITTFAGSDIYINGVLETSTPVTTTLLNGDSYDVYNLSGLTGDVTITSSTIAIVSFYGVSGVAGYAGYFSGFQRPSDVQIQPDATLSTPVEGCIYGLFAIQRTGDVSVPFTADVSFAGTAIQGTDYEVYDTSWNPLGTTITYAAGETTKYIIIDAYDDAVTEGTETIEVTFSWLLCNELQTASRTVDLEEPTISVTCQNDTTIYTDPGTCTANFSFGYPTVESHCSNSISRTDGSGLNSGDDFPIGTTTIEWTATTSDGEATDVCSFNVTVIDNIAPAITCPADITVNTDPGDCSANVTVPLATATDNCGVFILNDHDTYIQDFESFSNGDYIGVEASEWTTWSGSTGGAEDAQIVTNQANSGSNSIYFSSTSGSGGPQDVVLPFGGLIDSDIFNFETALYVETGSSAYFNFQGSETIGTSWALEATFNTDGTYNLSSGGISGTYSQGQWIDLRFRMNLTSNNWEFFINGVSQGTWSNGTNQIASVDIFPADANASFWIDDVSFSTDPAAGGGADASGIYPVGTTTVTYTAVDDAGNETTCTQDITVVDNQDPTISCPSNQSISVDASCQASLPDYLGSVTASDNCGFTLAQSPAAGTVLTPGTTTVTITATDTYGNTESCTFDVMAEDTDDPVATCPGDINVDLDENYEYIIPDFTSGASGSDVCSGPSDLVYSQDPTVGTAINSDQTVTIYVTDQAGNSGSCTFEIIVNPVVDTDGDGVADLYDLDDDNDGIPDTEERECTTAEPASLVEPATTIQGGTHVSAVYTNDNGYWSSSTSSINPVKATRENNLFAFETNGVTYTTGVENDRLIDTDGDGDPDEIDTDGDGIGDIPCSNSGWFAFQPSNIIDNEIFLEGSEIDGNPSSALGSTYISDPGNQPLNSLLYNGPHGLNLGTGIANIGGDWFFNVAGLDISTVGDGAPDILLSQVAQTGGVSHTVTFFDATGNAIGNSVEVSAEGTGELNFVVGESNYDIYNSDGSVFQTAADKELRLATIELQEFGITAANIGDISLMRVSLSSNADVAFIAHSFESFGDVCQDIDTDNDGIPNHLDLDSDNDGIYDLVEAGHGAADVNNDGVIDGGSSAFGENGLANSLETSTESGDINYNIKDSDADGNFDSIELDSDGDLCFDVEEAGYSDPNGDGLLGDSPVIANGLGLVTSGVDGYTTPIASNSVDFDYTVVTPPEAPTLPDITEECSATVTAPTTTSCTGIITGTTSDPTTYSTQGSYTITWTFTDASGNSTTANQNVIIDDTTNPTVSCPADQTFSAGASCQVSLPDYASGATSSDNCSVTVTQSPAAGTLLGVGTTTVTLTATDDAGNTSNCSFDVTVEDTENPVVACQDITVQLDATGNATITGADLDNGSADNCGIASLTSSQTAFDCTDFPTETVSSSDGYDVDIKVMPIAINPVGSTCAFGYSYTVTLAYQIDFSGSNIPASLYTLQGNINCDGSNIFFNLPNSGGSGVFTTSQAYTSQTNCATVTPADLACGGIDVDISGPGIPNTTVTVPTSNDITLTVEDNNGNTDVCSSQVTVEDNIAPSAVCQDISVNLDASGQASITTADIDNGSSDNCGIVHMELSQTDFTCADLGSNSVTLTVYDFYGNSDICTATVTVNDNQTPSLTCPADQTISQDASCSATMPDYTAGVAADNCSVTVTQLPAAGSSLSTGVTSVTLTATDAAGNSTNCSFDVTVEDSTNPTITCPGNQTVSANASCEVSLADYTGMATANDNCSVTVTQSPAVGATIGLGTTTVTLTATDGAGNMATCTFDVTVEDTTDPVIGSCQSDVSRSLDGSCDYSLEDFTGAISATDNCSAAGNITYTQSPAAGTILSGHGTTQVVTLTATDEAGNSADCTFTLTLEDTTAPSFSYCPSSLTETVDASCEWTVPDYAAQAAAANVASDNCTADAGITYTQSIAAGTVLSGHGTTQVITLTATDAAGNSTDCIGTITLQDTSNPTISCPADQTISANASCQASLPDYTSAATANDNCSVTVTQSPAAGATLNLGTTTVTLTATDGAGNTATCTFDVTVEDTTNPTVTCPADQTLSADASCQVNLPDYASGATASDNCSVTVTQSPVAGASLGLGTTTVTLTATDGAGNTATCTFDVTVEDTTNPTISCPADQTISATSGCDANLPDFTSLATANDNCDATPTLTQSPAVGAVVNGTSTVTITATDAAGNSSSCTFDVTVEDDTNPAISCPADQTVSANASCEATLADYTSLATASDNCDASPIVTQSPAAGATLSLGANTVTLTVTDAAGNTSSCTFDVVVEDATDPTISCPADQTISTTAACDASLPDYTGSATVGDNCDAAPTVTQSPIAGTSLGLGTTTVTLTVTDGAGNTATCTFDVTVEDTTNPTVTCPADQTLSADASCQVNLPDYASGATASDNCSVAVTQSPVAGTPLGLGTTTVTLTATDGAGNTATCTFDVTVEDTTNPTVTCPADQTLSADASCQVNLPDYTSGATASDNCSVMVTQSPIAGTSLGLGTTTVTLTATDGAGNSATCTFDVTVEDTTNPTVTCPADQTLSADASCQVSLPDYASGSTAGDNCSVTVTQSPVAGASLGLGTTTVTLTATDGAGNTATCTFDVTVEDTTNPTISCPGDQNVSADTNCEFTMADYTSLATASDNCSVTVTQSPASGATVSGTTTVTLTATDASGNTATCTFDVVVTDNAAPVINTCQSDVSRDLDGSCEYSLEDFTGAIVATDNCTPDANIVYTQSPAAGVILTGVGSSHTITLTATDTNGNSSDCTFDITLEDNTAPAIACPADFDEATDASCEFSIPDYTGLATASDNCDAGVVVTQSPGVGTVLSGEGTTQVITLTATDASGNSTDCSFTITLIDDIDPTITCPA
ncbi:HYR domain-containing protein, partial [Halocola ammonii]